MSLKSVLFLLVKALVAGAICVWLLSRVDGAALLASLSSAAPAPLAVGFALCVAVLAIAAWRWRRLLGLFEIRASTGSLFSIVWIGQFFSMFLPGPLGDDASRMVYISRIAPGRVGEACLSVVLDRGLGLCSVFALCLLALPLQWKLLAANVQTSLLAGAVFAMGAAVTVGGAAFLVFGRTSSASGLFHLFPEGKVRDELLRIWNLAASHKVVVIQVFIAAVVVQLLNCAIFWLAGLAVGITLPLAAWINFVPIILAANILPITIAGLGVREYLVVLFLGVVGGVPHSQAMAASLLVFASMVAVSAAGGLVFVLYRVRGHSDRSQVAANK